MRSRPGYKTTEVGEIPEEWEVARLRDVILEAKSGFASGKRDAEGIIQLRMNSIGTDGWLVEDSYVRVPPPSGVDEYLLRPDDILLTNTSGSSDLIGKTALYRGEFDDATYSNHITRIRVRTDSVLPGWILYILLRNWDVGILRSLSVTQAGGQKTIRSDDLLASRIPVPHPAEQGKIASILSTVDDAIQKTGEIIAKSQQLKKGLMQQLLAKGIGHTEFKKTEIGEIPEVWKVGRLGEVLETCQYGISAPLYLSGEHAVLRMNNLIDGHVKATDVKYANMDREAFNDFRLKKGDVLFNRTNSYDLVGKVGIFSLDGEYSFASYLIRLRTVPQGADPRFINYLLNSDIYQERLRSLATRGSSQANINAKNLKSILIPLPPLPEQQRIVTILSTTDKKIHNEEEKRRRLERTKRGLMQVLLSGKVRVRVT